MAAVSGPGAGATWTAAAVKGSHGLSALSAAGRPAGQVAADQGAEQGRGRAEDHPGGELPTRDPGARRRRAGALYTRGPASPVAARAGAPASPLPVRERAPLLRR